MRVLVGGLVGDGAVAGREPHAVGVAAAAADLEQGAGVGADVGGVTFKGVILPLAWACSAKTPFFAFSRAFFTGPCSPFESLYLNPLVASPLQNGLPAAFVPWGRLKTYWLGVVPLALIVSVAPFVAGLPTIVFGFPFSLAFTCTLRLSGVAGFFVGSRSRE